MANKIRTGVASQIIGSFEDIGEKVVQEVVKVPGDVAGKALESLGTSSGTKTSGQTTGKTDTTKAGENLPAEQLQTAKTKQAKQATARAALEAIAGVGKKEKEPTVWEKIQSEIEQKKQMAAQQAKAAAYAQLPKTGSKARRGNLYGVTKQKSGSETTKNVRGD